MRAQWDPHGPHWARGVRSRGARARDQQSCCFQENVMFRRTNRNCDPGSCQGWGEDTQVPIDTLPRTQLYRNLRRRAHHLPCDPNIFRPQIQHLKTLPFSNFGRKSSWMGQERNQNGTNMEPKWNLLNHKEPNWNQHGAKRNRNRRKIKPKGTEMEPKWKQKEPKEPKGNQTETNMAPRGLDR